MKTRWEPCGLCALAACLMLTGCNTTYDSTNFRAHPPRSILVLPPLNETTAVKGTYGTLSTVTFPLAEMGYYVYPVAVTDHFLKENGMPTAGEMHAVPLDKIREIIGADAVLYLTLKDYKTRYFFYFCTTTVAVEGKLVDTRTGLILWEGKGKHREIVAGSPLDIAVYQMLFTSMDHAHEISGAANANLIKMKDHGLPYGPYHPKAESQ